MADEPGKTPFYEAMEACRPGSQDLADPGLAFLAEALAQDPALAARYQWMQEVDQQVGAAFGEVAIPAGLVNRILEKLPVPPPLAEPGQPGGFSSEDISLPGEAAGGTSQDAVPEFSPPGGQIAESGEVFLRQDRENGGYALNTAIPPPKPASFTMRKKHRRWFLAWGLVGAAAAGCLLAIFWPTDSTAPLSLAQIQAEALQFAMSEPEEIFGSGQPWDVHQPIGPFRWSRAIWARGEVRVRKVKGLLGGEGVAFDLPAADRPPATLYVIPLGQSGTVRVEEGLPVEPPRYDQTVRTGGYCAAAWQENGLLYMLVVHRDSARAYYQFFLPQVVT